MGLKIDYRTEIKESEEELLKMQKGAKESLLRDRLRYLHSLKTGESETQEQAASKINLGGRAGQKIWALYKKEGIKGLLSIKPKSGRPRKINQEQILELEEELKKDKIQFQKEIADYLWDKYGIKCSIPTVCVSLKRAQIKKNLPPEQ